MVDLEGVTVKRVAGGLRVVSEALSKVVNCCVRKRQDQDFSGITEFIVDDSLDARCLAGTRSSQEHFHV